MVESVCVFYTSVFCTGVIYVYIYICVYMYVCSTLAYSVLVLYIYIYVLYWCYTQPVSGLWCAGGVSTAHTYPLATCLKRNRSQGKVCTKSIT